MKKLHLFGLALALSATACTGEGDDDTGASTSDTTGATDSDTSTTTDGTGGTSDGTGGTTAGGACPGISPDATAEAGDACTSNNDCVSGICLLYGDVPTPSDAVCGEATPNCETRMTGTVLNFETGEAVPNTDVKLAKALEAATNPTGVTPVIETTSDADGKVDATSSEPVNSAIGVVALVGGGDFYLTATGVASPVDGNLYAPGTGIHELWTVPAATLTAWSTALTADTDVMPFLPLGDQGGVVGFVRDASSGDPVAGAVVVPKKDTSTAVIRYLADDGVTFQDTMTGTSGIFVLVAPGLAEEFTVEKDGMNIAAADGTAGSANGAIFTLIMDVNP